MKRFFFIVVLGVMALSAQTSQAQSLTDLFNGLSKLLGGTTESQAQQAPKPVYPTAEEILGTWVYQSPEMVYSGNDALATVAISTLKGQLPTLASKFGIEAGNVYATVNKKSIKAWRGDDKSTATYTYIPSSGQAIISGKFNDRKVILTGVAEVVDGNIRILFKAKELMAIVAETNTFKQNTTLQAIKGVIDRYPEIQVGVIVKRQ